MDIEKLKNELLFDEGLKNSAYQDHLGYWTIGVGRLIDERKGGQISKEEALYLLGNDIAKIDTQVKKSLPWSTKLSDTRQRALCNMAFQLGINGLLGFKNSLKLLEQGLFAQAADNMLLSKWAEQTPARAKRVTDMIRFG